MLAVHHCFSRIRQLGLLMSVSLGLGACSTTGVNLVSQTPPPPVREQASNLVLKSKTAAVKAPIPARKIQRSVIEPAYSPAKKFEKSAWCTYLTETAAADATILRAPTVSGSINKEGNKGVAMTYDVMGIAKAELIGDAADAKCRRYLANAALNRMAVAVPNVLSRAGHKAKSSVIRRHSRKLRAIKTLVRRELVTGNLDRAQATKLLLASDSVVADGATAASEAAKRQGLVAFDLKNLVELSRQLSKAERELADINSNIRSVDSMSVNFGGGWRESGTEAGALVPKSDFYGGVNVSFKLGAINPTRFAHERAAARARLRAHHDEPGSVFWKLRELESAQTRGRKGIAKTLSALSASRVVARRQKSNLPSDDPTYLVQRFGIEVELIRLESEIAGTRATLRQIDGNLVKLRQLRYRS